jgi:trimeric autotransporter adhesin
MKVAAALVTALAAGTAGAQQYTISTLAGGGPENVTATAASLRNPSAVAVDGSGNVYIAAGVFANKVYKVTAATGKMATLAGTGDYGRGSDSVTATNGQLAWPGGITVDTAGTAVYVSDTENNCIRKIVVATGVMTTYAGISGTGGYNGDGILATSAQLNHPMGLALDSSGNLYVADSANHRVRRVAASGGITTLAGTGTAGYNGDGINAATAKLSLPTGVAVDASGNVFVAEAAGQRIRRLNATGGLIVTVAGTGVSGNNWDGGALIAMLNMPRAVAVDSSGNLYIAEAGNHRIRKVVGVAITTVAGNTATAGYSGDGGAAASAMLNFPTDVKVDGSGALYVVDSLNLRVRKITSGTINTISGNGTQFFSGDGDVAATGALNGPSATARDSAGNVYIADTYNHRIRMVATGTGTLSAIAGTGTAGFSGDGTSATAATLNSPGGIAIDGSNNIYIADTNNHRIRKISSGVITTVAGTGTAGYSGDGGAATAATLNYPAAVALDSAGTTLYIADTYNHRVRKIVSGTISTVAGTGTAGYNGDGIAPALAQLRYPHGVATDTGGALYIADTLNHRVRKVSGGAISTVAGNGNAGFGGDGSAATAAQVNYPAGLSVDASSNLYIADSANHRIRRVSAGGTISTAAGSGTPGFAGDGAAATSAQLSFPGGVLADSTGNLYISDGGNQRVRYATLAGGSITEADTVIDVEPAGSTVIVDGTSYTVPHVFDWAPASVHTIQAVPPPTSPAGTRYGFSHWSDGGAISHSVNAAATSTNLSAAFDTQVLIATTVSPAAGGAIAITPASGDSYYTAGSTVQATATPASGYTLANFSGVASGTTSPLNFTVHASGTLTANFTAAAGASDSASVTISASPSSASAVVDGVAYALPKTFTWTAGSAHTIQAVAPASPPANTRYVFSQWSDLGAQSHSITPAAGSSTYTASFVTEVLIATAVSPVGAGGVTLSPAAADGYYATGTPVQATAAANAGYVFQNFSGLLSGSTPRGSFTAATPGSVTATFTVSSTTPGSFSPIRVNAGGAAYLDAAGNVWAADSGASAGMGLVTASNIAATADPFLYQSAHANGSSPFAYQWSVPNGNYVVRLRFAETVPAQAGRRVLGISINGTSVANSFDVVAQAGSANAALDRVYPVTVTGGQISIALSPVSGAGPLISAIEVLPAGEPYVAIQPSVAFAVASQTVSFTATSSGATAYSITPQAGSISAAGVYTAPSAISAVQNVLVTGSSGSATARATITLLPDAWKSEDLGYPNDPGGFSMSNGSYAVKGSGDIGGSADDFRYAWQPLNGDGMITARIAAAAGDTLPLRTGVMIRQSAAADAPMAFIALWNGNTPMFETRSVASAPIATQYGPTAFSWLRVTRKGNVFTAYVSPDGVAWYAVGSPVTIAMSAQVLAGLAVSTGYAGAVQAVFDQVSVEGSPTAIWINQSQSAVAAGQQATFTATVTGATNTGVTWSIVPASAGSINAATGAYTAPSSLSAATPSVTVKATSAADPARSSSVVVALGSAFQPIRINAGGGTLSTVDGVFWGADMGASGGTIVSTTATIQGAATPALYQTQRTHTGTFSYTFYVPNGTYSVKLKFAEIGYSVTAGQRVFNVGINGVAALSNFDIAAQAGGAFKAFEQTSATTVSNGRILITFNPVTGSPAVNAIEITQTGSSLVAGPVVR